MKSNLLSAGLGLLVLAAIVGFVIYRLRGVIVHTQQPDLLCC